MNRSPDSTTRCSRARRTGLLVGAAAGRWSPVGPALFRSRHPRRPPPAPAPPAAAPNPEAITSTGSVCSAVGPVVATLKAPPAIDQNALPAARQAYLNYLDDAVGRTDTALRELATAGPPPVENGPQLADQVRTQVNELRAELAQARADVAGADPANPAALGPAVGAPATCWGPSPTRPPVMRP